MSMRTPETEQKYREARAAGTLIGLENEPDAPGTPLFTYWRVVENKFPHDRHHTKHLLVILKRKCRFDELSLAELQELWHSVIFWADDKFDYIKFNFASVRTVPNIPHLHLLTLKGEYKNGSKRV